MTKLDRTITRLKRTQCRMSPSERIEALERLAQDLAQTALDADDTITAIEVIALLLRHGLTPSWRTAANKYGLHPSWHQRLLKEIEKHEDRARSKKL